MSKFHYTALDAKGDEIIGVLDADSEADAIGKLRQDGFYPTKVIEEGKGDVAAIKKKARSSKTKGKVTTSKGAVGGAIKNKAMMLFTRQLATLIDSGLPLLRGLTVLGKQEPNPVLQRTIKSLADSVQTGSTFSESLAQYPKTFNKLYVNMVKAGELGGVLELVLNRLAEYLEKAQKLKNKIVAAMVYPMIVMFIAVAIMIFLMVFIVPQFEKIFEDLLGSRSALPGITQFVIGISRTLASYTGLYVLAGLIVVGIFGKLWAGTKGGRRVMDGLKLKIPLFGDIQRKSAIARFTRTLGTLVTSGVPILQALNITRETAGNMVIAESIAKVHDAVKEGEPMVTPMEGSKVFPPMVISMVEVGEESGQLPEMLLRIADVYDNEVETAVGALTSMLEPIMIVMLAVVVGTIVIALFLPLITIIQKMQEGTGG
jgi:type IV pilus assembly protein PilC